MDALSKTSFALPTTDFNKLVAGVVSLGSAKPPSQASAPSGGLFEGSPIVPGLGLGASPPQMPSMDVYLKYQAAEADQQTDQNAFLKQFESDFKAKKDTIFQTNHYEFDANGHPHLVSGAETVDERHQRETWENKQQTAIEKDANRAEAAVQQQLQAEEQTLLKVRMDAALSHTDASMEINTLMQQIGKLQQQATDIATRGEFMKDTVGAELLPDPDKVKPVTVPAPTSAPSTATTDSPDASSGATGSTTSSTGTAPAAPATITYYESPSSYSQSLAAFRDESLQAFTHLKTHQAQQLASSPAGKLIAAYQDEIKNFMAGQRAQLSTLQQPPVPVVDMSGTCQSNILSSDNSAAGAIPVLDMSSFDQYEEMLQQVGADTTAAELMRRMMSYASNPAPAVTSTSGSQPVNPSGTSTAGSLPVNSSGTSTAGSLPANSSGTSTINPLIEILTRTSSYLPVNSSETSTINPLLERLRSTSGSRPVY